MFALDYTQRTAVEDGLEPLAPAPARIPMARLEKALAPAWWLAAAVVVTIALQLAGPAGEAAVSALAGTAALVYLGTATIAGRPGIAMLDLAAAVAAAGLAIAGTAPATVMGVHVLWGALRISSPAAPGRGLAAGWSAFFGAQAVLLGLVA